MNKVTIILPTMSKYLDISDIFLHLFHKYWVDCPYELVVSIAGTVNGNLNEKIISNTSETSLLKCIYNASKNYNSDAYICLLGDSFISSRIETEEIEAFIDTFLNSELEYCNLYPRKPYRNQMKRLCTDDRIRFIGKNEVYAMSFVGFICKPSFINKNFNTDESDLDFELKYIKKACKEFDSNKYWKGYGVLNNDLFHFVHGIDKGMWTYEAAQLLKKEKIDISKRKKLSKLDLMKRRCINKFQYFVNPRYRAIIKKFLTKLGFKFTTKI